MKITSVKSSTDGFYVVVSAGNLFSYTLRRSYESETHRKLAVIGASFEAAQLQADADIALHILDELLKRARRLATLEEVR